MRWYKTYLFGANFSKIDAYPPKSAILGHLTKWKIIFLNMQNLLKYGLYKYIFVNNILKSQYVDEKSWAWEMYPRTTEYSHFVRTHIDDCIPQLSMSGILTLTHSGHIRGSRNYPYFVFWIVSSSVGSALVLGIFTQHCFIVPFILCCISVLFIHSIICPYRSIAYGDGQNKKATWIKKLKNLYLHSVLRGSGSRR